MIDLDELERLEREATPGPWRTDRFGVVWIDKESLRAAGARWLIRGQVASVTGIPDDLPSDHVDRNTSFIAAARNAMPALLRELRAARDIVEHVRMNPEYATMRAVNLVALYDHAAKGER